MLLISTLTQAQAADSPNVLLIVADDLGYADVGFHGGKEVPTPHLDALAASGVRCTSGYVAAPYCSPSRAGLLTGTSPTRFGHEFNPHVGDEAKLGLPLDRRTLADQLKGAGYATALVGKWHQGFDEAHHPQSRGFDEFFGFLVGGHNFFLHADATPRFGSAHSHDLIYRGREAQRLDGYTTDLFTDEAIRFISPSPAKESRKPWFLYLAYNAVHTPLEITESHRSRIPSTITDPQRIGYLSLLLGLDDAIGRLMKSLQESGQAEQTLVFFISDNGGANQKPYLAYNTGVNTPLRGMKGQTLEGGIRVPFVVSWPGVLPKGTQYDAPVSALDIFATASSVAAIPLPNTAEGTDLLPHLKGEKSTPPHAELCWRFGPQRAIRQGQWKLVQWRDFSSRTESGWELYDLSQDIGEQQNLATQYPEKVTVLRQKWETWDQQNIAPLWHGSPTEDPTAPAPIKKR